MNAPDDNSPTHEHGGDDRLLTADDVAALMRVTRSWVYAETRRDALPHLRLGRYVRYRRSAIEVWMRTVERGPGTSTGARR